MPGDPSSAAFWVVGATITPGSDLVIEGVACNPTRIAFVDVLRRMGATVDIDITGEELGEPVGDLHVTASALRATTIGGDEIPLVQDELPVLAVAAAFADGVTEISDAGELRVKESDRIATVEALLASLGVGVETAADALSIRGGRPRACPAHEPRRPSPRHGGGDRGERHRRRVGGRRLERDRGLVSRVHRRPHDGHGAHVTGRVVAIDGPAGSGKSTTARGVADALGLHTLDTGAMYRAVTLAAMEAGVDIGDGDAVAAVAERAGIELGDGSVHLDGRDVSAEIRGPEVTAAVSAVSSHPAVRKVLVDRQRAWVLEHGGGVVEGRDIGTVVFPDAPVKVFLNADDDVRAARRRRDEEASAREVAVDVVRDALDPARPGRRLARPGAAAPRMPRPTRWCRHHAAARSTRSSPRSCAGASRGTDRRRGAP